MTHRAEGLVHFIMLKLTHILDPNFNLEWMINSTIKFGMKLLTHLQTSIVQPLKFASG